MRKKPQDPVDIGICAGAGGFAIGARNAGFRQLMLFERDPWAQLTQTTNKLATRRPPNWEEHKGDITKVDWTPLKGRVRLLFGGIPCQPFSLGGAHKGQADDRNMFPELLRATNCLGPQSVVLENVPGLLRPAFSKYWEYMLKALSAATTPPREGESWRTHDKRLRTLEQEGKLNRVYTVEWRLLDAADFGVPQHRRRVFVVATPLDSKPYIFPAPTHGRPNGRVGSARPTLNRTSQPTLKPWVTVREALQPLWKPARSPAHAKLNHWSIPGAREYPGHTGSAANKPSKTIKAGVHGVAGGENTLKTRTGVRYYTLREAAIIQSFPVDYHFAGARSHVTRQIGNAVPPKLAQAVLSPLAALLAD